MIKEFTDLQVWQEAHRLVLSIYTITNDFPLKENFGLTSQIQRASVSITSNIAEGFGRYNFKEKIRFYYISEGSLCELKNQLIIAKDLKYIDKDTFDNLYEHSNLIHRLLKGLIKATKGLVPN